MKRVLVVSPRFPLPLKSGEQIRIFHTLKELSKRYNVSLVSLFLNGEGQNKIKEIEAMGVDVQAVNHTCSRRGAVVKFLTSRKSYRVAKFSNNEFSNIIQNKIKHEDFDFIWTHYFSTLRSLPENTQENVIVDEHNNDIDVWRSYRNKGIIEKIIAKINIRRIQRLRSQEYEKIDAIISVSEADAEAARSWAESKTVITVPNGVDIETFSPSVRKKDVKSAVVFVGSLDRQRNIEAAQWFTRECWGSIYDTNPDAEFQIIGRNPSKKVKKLDKKPGVTVIGEVDELGQYYDQASVVIVPLAFGGGTKLKTLEALAMECAVVTTPEGSAGINIVDEEHALIRERGDSFAYVVSDLLSSPEKREEMGKKGRELVCRKYSWENLMEKAVHNVKIEFD